MTGELRRVGLADDPRVRFIDGVVVDDMAPFRARGEKGVFLAHLKILREAAEANKSVLILEDDADFAEGVELWPASAGDDINYGGYVASNPADLANSEIIGAHCMGFSAGAARALVPFLEQLLEHQSPPPIDGAYVWFRRQHPQFMSSFADPVIAIQRPSRSDIAHLRAFDRVPILRPAISAGRGFKRKLQRGELTFGLPEAIAVSAIGIAIASLAAYHYSH
jgi:glycosyl transferase family 25